MSVSLNIANSARIFLLRLRFRFQFHRNTQALVVDCYRCFARSLRSKIEDVLKLGDADLPNPTADQEEQALPGMNKYRANNYYQYMLGRYLLAVPFIQDKRVLDAGCGLGWGSYLIAEYPKGILAMDVNESAIDFCQEHWSQPRLSFVRGSVLELESLGRTFDTILSYEVIEHLSDDDGVDFLRQAYRVLEPGGVLILSSVFPENSEQARQDQIQNPYHLNLFTTQELRTHAEEIGFRQTVTFGWLLGVLRK